MVKPNAELRCSFWEKKPMLVKAPSLPPASRVASSVDRASTDQHWTLSCSPGIVTHFTGKKEILQNLNIHQSRRKQRNPPFNFTVDRYLIALPLCPTFKTTPAAVVHLLAHKQRKNKSTLIFSCASSSAVAWVYFCRNDLALEKFCAR